IPLGLGVNGTIYTAGSIDILAGLIFILLSLKSKLLESFLKREKSEIQPEPKPKTKQNFGYLLLIIFFFTGFAALAL
ncbi:hypothetical protein GW934_03485, partial [Candidatus Falkowbacteria bacterium]|nr:hypothetical protein [Candidatus Falkowbacteria bacterium]